MNINRQTILRKITNRNGRSVLLILVAALALSGCGGAGGNGGNDNARGAASSNVNAASPAAAGAANVATANVAAVAPTPMSAGGGVAQPAATPNAGARGNSNAPPANMPKPQIGSGGNDFALFTQARGAINADADLKTANITVEVKDGVMTLSGTVASAEQKSKAEQLVQAVGPKALKNQLRVSGGK